MFFIITDGDYSYFLNDKGRDFREISFPVSLRYLKDGAVLIELNNKNEVYEFRGVVARGEYTPKEEPENWDFFEEEKT